MRPLLDHANTVIAVHKSQLVPKDLIGETDTVTILLKEGYDSCLNWSRRTSLVRLSCDPRVLHQSFQSQLVPKDLIGETRCCGYFDEQRARLSQLVPKDLIGETDSFAGGGSGMTRGSQLVPKDLIGETS